MRKCLIDFQELDAAIKKKMQESEVIAGMVNALVKESATTAIRQDEFSRKHEALESRFDDVVAELNRLNVERILHQQQGKEMGLFIRTLKKSRQVLTEWEDTIWTVMVEKAIIHKDKSITFILFHGNHVTVG